MKKKLVILSLITIVCLIIILLFLMYNTSRKVILYDYRSIYSNQYNINSKIDLHEIDRIIDKMRSVDNDINKEIKLGGFIIIEEYKKNLIEAYRVQGSNVTKYIYKESYDNLISTSYFYLDDEYSQKLNDLCDKLSK